jgi:3',5'-cyclic AMP phosphodiesterase CpdA
MSTDSNSFSFAQLSDPHLSTLDNVRWYQLLSKRLLGYISWRKKRRHEHRTEVLEALALDLDQDRPDHVLVTGDLTHISLPDEFKQAKQWLQSLGDPKDVSVIPGNHDAYVRVPWQQGLANWQDYMESDDTTTVSGPGLFPSLRIRGPVAFIGLSTAVPAPPFLATGRLGKRQLKQLKALLKQTGEQGLFRVVFLHHPPVPGQEKWRKRLTDDRSLCEVLDQCGAELVLHGHMHRSIDSQIEIPGGHIPVFGIPSASAIGELSGRPSQYFRYQVEEKSHEWLLDVLVRAYDYKEHVFKHERKMSLAIPKKPGLNI